MFVQLRNPALALHEELDDGRQFELWHVRPRLDRYRYQAKSEPIKKLWCDLLRPWLRKWGSIPDFDSELRKASCTGAYPADVRRCLDVRTTLSNVKHVAPTSYPRPAKGICKPPISYFIIIISGLAFFFLLKAFSFC